MSTSVRYRAGVMALLAVCVPLGFYPTAESVVSAAQRSHGALVGVGAQVMLASSAAPTHAKGKAPTLSWLHTDGVQILDSSGREVILRGFGTVDNTTTGTPVTYTLSDYQRMRALGADYQSIRLQAYRLFGIARNETDTQYIQRLVNMVSLAKQVGMYTDFKLTMKYNPGFFGPTQPQAWAALWSNRNNAQDKIISQWSKLWNQFKGEPAVIGYDIMNEPEAGALQVSAHDFEAQYLTPFYQKAIDALRQIDTKHLVFIQAPWDAAKLEYSPYDVAINRPNIVYAPHFYPNFANWVTKDDTSTQDYQPILQRYISEAKFQHAPLLIGEYGTPINLAKQGDPAYRNKVAMLDQAAVSLFNQNGLGMTREFYSDDSAANATIAGQSFSWAVISGTTGLNGTMRTFVTNVEASPYPQVTAGRVTSFTFDAMKRSFHLSYTPTYSIHKKQIQRYLMIYVPQSQHYAGGFSVKFKSGLAFAYKNSKGKGSKVSWLLSLIKAKGKTKSAQPKPGSYSWDNKAQTFLYSANESASKASAETLDITTP